jgi:predicted kinase
VERKRMTGVLGTSARADIGKGIYTADLSHRVYARLADTAEICLGAGCSVVVDAAFLNAADRALFQGLAARLDLPFLIVACEAAPEILANRISARAIEGSDPSDATSAVLAEQLKNQQPLSALERLHAVIVDSAADDAIGAVLARRPTVA